jgi:hypothetical protein
MGVIFILNKVMVIGQAVKQKILIEYKNENKIKVFKKVPI